MHAMRTVNNYRGLKVYVVEPDEEVPGWVDEDVRGGNGVLARGAFPTPTLLARILDRFIDEELNAEAERRAGGPSGPSPIARPGPVSRTGPSGVPPRANRPRR
jgi:hypothetical protein